MHDQIALHHVSLVVADTSRALSFYGGVLGLQEDLSRPDLSVEGAWLKVGELQIHLLQVPNPDPVEGRPAHGGRDRHVAFAVPDLDAIRLRLEQRGVPYTLSRSGRRALFCRDPDGNACELVEV
jgi:glyoxylase I family protein